MGEGDGVGIFVFAFGLEVYGRGFIKARRRGVVPGGAVGIAALGSHGRDEVTLGACFRASAELVPGLASAA